jgi:Transposase DDE domain
MQCNTVPAATFKSLFQELIPWSFILSVLRRCGLRRRRPPVVTTVELIQSLVFHVIAESGTLAQHVKQLTGKTITDGALAQRRALLPQEVFAQLMAGALKPKADPARHPEAFYKGLRLTGVDGSSFSVSNTPQVKKRMRKAKSRRGRAAFPKVGVAVMVELGLHNPLAAALGAAGESEMVLAKQVLAAQPAQSLLLSDRYYGVGQILVELSDQDQRHVLARVKDNLRRRLLETYADGSALVEIRGAGGKTRQMREIVGRVQRRGRGRFTRVRLWTSLLDWRRYPAAELLALYARRWEQELFYKELKVDMRSTPLLQSHTPLTAMQEIAALILAYSVLVGYRVEAGAVGEVGVLRISFLKTLQAVQGLWRFLEVSADLLTPAQVRLVVRRTLRQIADMAIGKRRQRSCPRALRQPVSSWPRLRKNTSQTAEINYTVREIYA